MIRLNVPVSINARPINPAATKDGSGHHHPMRIHPSNGCSRRHLPPEWLRGGVSSFRHALWDSLEPEQFVACCSTLTDRAIAADVARVPDVTVKAKFRTQEGRSQLGNQLLRCITPRAEPILQISIEARFVCRPVGQLMERRVIEMICALESLECGHRDKIAARHVEGFAMALADVSAS